MLFVERLLVVMCSGYGVVCCLYLFGVFCLSSLVFRLLSYVVGCWLVVVCRMSCVLCCVDVV